MRSATTVFVGDPFTIDAALSATGPNHGFRVQVNDVDKFADIVGCTPTCAMDSGFGGLYANFAGTVSASKSIKIEMLATAVGAPHWSVCFYDADNSEDQFYCGDITTTFR